MSTCCVLYFHFVPSTEKVSLGHGPDMDQAGKKIVNGIFSIITSSRLNFTAGPRVHFRFPINFFEILVQ